jgi:hypothetical protein
LTGILCSLVNELSIDPIFVAAAGDVGIRDIARRLPRGVMWINPSSVKVQRENGRQPETIFSSLGVTPDNLKPCNAHVPPNPSADDECHIVCDHAI